ncbi:arrestin domain-containing protein 2-like isoform X1 [Macrosteles quadrilineatus]|uniref:arrestin domain-containing protein 2-like isoform X1 n=1 Tax=Macrosteles quadrilineatus TaxID=74068 RepID=UPI0023E1ADE6|nr:arrestin domain-containing protein 2-like isoform X1 [Macrosteles quadrilineatus]
MLSVVFGRTSSVYHPDETITGDVVLNIPTQCTILDLTVNFCGVSSLSLIIAEGEDNKCEKLEVEESDMHLDVFNHLLDVRSYRGVELEPGVYTYPFSLRLPSHLPSSHVSTYGNITYYLHVHLHSTTSTQHFRKPFYLVAPVNINIFEAFQSLQSSEVTKKYGLFNRPVKLKASVPRSCYVPGDVVSVVVEVSNGTSKTLEYLFCTLKQVTTVFAHLDDKTVSRVTKQCLKTEAHKTTRSNRHHSWVCQMSTSPSLTPTIANSSLVLVTYCIQVSGKLTGVPVPPGVEIPIVFGTRTPVQPTDPIPHSLTANRRVSQQNLESNVPLRRRRYTIQPPLKPQAPPRRISHQVYSTAATHRISISLQPFEEGKPELYQSEV